MPKTTGNAFRAEPVYYIHFNTRKKDLIAQWRTFMRDLMRQPEWRDCGYIVWDPDRRDMGGHGTISTESGQVGDWELCKKLMQKLRFSVKTVGSNCGFMVRYSTRIPHLTLLEPDSSDEDNDDQDKKEEEEDEEDEAPTTGRKRRLRLIDDDPKRDNKRRYSVEFAVQD